jgi:hypothetical protein
MASSVGHSIHIYTNILREAESPSLISSVEASNQSIVKVLGRPVFRSDMCRCLEMLQKSFTGSGGGSFRRQSTSCRCVLIIRYCYKTNSCVASWIAEAK